LKATGIVRRIDDLGRVVIPKEIRRSLRIREGDPLEIFVDREGEVILKKYSPIGELGEFAQEYADTLYDATGQIVLITDRDVVVAVAGADKRTWIDRAVPPAVEEVMESRRARQLHGLGPAEQDDLIAVWQLASAVVAPIVAEGDPIGTVVVATTDESRQLGETELKLVETAAGFLAKQLEG